MDTEADIDRDLQVSETYRHGRTQSKLNAARLALKNILKRAKGKNDEASAIRSLAKLGLDLSLPDPEPEAYIAFVTEPGNYTCTNARCGLDGQHTPACRKGHVISTGGTVVDAEWKEIDET